MVTLRHAERSNHWEMPVLRDHVQKGQKVLEKVLQASLPLGCLGRKPPTPECKAHDWRFTLEEMEALKLPVFSFGSSSFCTYCGQTAVSRDHVIPVSFQNTTDEGRWSRNGPWCWCCKECNSKLHDKYFDSFKDRCEWVHYWLDKASQPIEWHEWELEKLDYNLRTFIRADILKRRLMRQRSDFYQSREFYLNLESLAWEVGQLTPSLGAKYLKAYFSSIIHDLHSLYES